MIKISRQIKQLSLNLQVSVFIVSFVVTQVMQAQNSKVEFLNKANLNLQSSQLNDSSVANKSVFKFDSESDKNKENLFTELSLSQGLIQTTSLTNYSIHFTSKKEKKSLFLTSFNFDQLKESENLFNYDGKVEQYKFNNENAPTYFTLPQFNYELKFQNNNYVWLGRKINHTSAVDQVLNLGLWHSTATIDQLHYETQGQIGVEYNHVFAKNYEASFAFFPLYLPNQNSPYTIDDGQIIQYSPYANQTPIKFQFNDELHSISYKVADYKVSEIIFNPAVRFVFSKNHLKSNQDEFSSENQWQVGYKYAPLNELNLLRKTKVDLDLNAEVLIKPQVQYSHQWAADYILAQNQYQNYFFSTLYDQPNNVKTDVETPIYQKREPLLATTFGGQSQLKLFTLDSTYIQYAYAQVDGGRTIDINSKTNVVDDGQMTDQRAVYKQAIIVSLTQPSVFFKKNQISKVKYLYDVKQKGEIVELSHQIEVIKNLSLKTQVTILSSKENLNESTQNHFITRNQAQDSVQVGVNYVY